MARQVTRSEYEARMGKLKLPPNFWDDMGTPDCGPDCPVVGPTWYEAVAYCNKLSEEKGLAKCYTCTSTGKELQCDVAPGYQEGKIYGCPGYRLPTEAEFEYASRAGSISDYYNGKQVVVCGDEDQDPNLDPIAWYKGNSSMRLQPVGQLEANGWGLYDMAGNAFDWINDLSRYDLGTKPAVDPFGAYTTEAFKRVGRGGSYVEPPRNLRASYRFWWAHDHRCTRLSLRCARTLD
jgi:formylglycine-generating enzyme required for sulfatase activity